MNYLDLIFNIKYTLIIFLISFIYLTKSYFSGGKCKSKARLDGKTVVITGANTGIGKETALELAKRGSKVILACRDLKKADETAQKIRKITNNDNVVIELLDLSSMESIRLFCKKIISQEKRIDILINNAGVSLCPKTRTKDGFETHFGVNHLGHFLLTNLLLDKIKQSSPSRIINLSSLVHKTGKIHWNDINLDKNYNPTVAYAQSKLANILFTRELAFRLKGSGVSVFSVHPGIVRTEIDRTLRQRFGLIFTILKTLFYPIFFYFSKSSNQGCQTTIHCALDEKITSLSGSYFSDCKKEELQAHAMNDHDALKLWELSEKMTLLNTE